MSAEKIAVLGLTEIMKAILKISNRDKKKDENLDSYEIANYTIISKMIF